MAVYDKFGKPIKSGRTVSEVDKDGARELALFAENTSEIYNGILTSVLTNLQRKAKKGIYDKNKAVVAWLHVIDEAAKLYDNWYGSGRDSLQLFNKATRMEAARQLMNRMDEDVFQDVEIESSKKTKKKSWKHPDEVAKDEGADITCSRKPIKSSQDASNDYGFYWEGDYVYDKDGNYWYYGDYINGNTGIEPYSSYMQAVKETADDIRDSYLKDEILDPEDYAYQLVDFTIETLPDPGKFIKEYEGFVKSSHKSIKSAIDGGWEVDSSDVPEALDLFVEYYGEETALEEIAKSMSTDTLLENIEWIAQQWGFGEDLESVEGTWNKYEYAKEIMGVTELFNNLTQAAGYDELAEDLAFIFRQYDFREWDKYDNEEDIYSSKINSSKEDKAEEDGPHMKFKTLDEDTKFELREQIEDELEALLDKLNVKFTTDVWEETVQYILSFFEEDNAYNPKTAKQAVHEWYLDTKDDFPEMFDSKKQKVASAKYCEWIRSKRLIKSAKKFFK